MFRCFTCKCDLLVIQIHLQNHAAKHVIAIEDCPISKSSIYVGPLLSTVYKVNKIVWSGDFWKTYNPEDEDYQQLYSPASLRDTFGELVHLVNGIFTPEELSFLTKEVEWLERVARLIKRGKLKKGRRMVTFGIYYKYGKLAWFKHSNPECYIQSKAFVKIIAKGLKRNFPSVFEHLENVCAIKDMQTNDSRIGESPFSCLAVTKDYKMNVHRNRNDFSYGFFLWLGESGTLRNGNGVRLYLPKLGYFFEPQVGDVMLIKTGEIHHCMRTTGARSQFGVALFLHANLLEWWKVIVGNAKKIQGGLELDEEETKKATLWLENNRMYQAHIRG